MKTTRKTNNKSGRELLADSLKLPRDMVLGEFKLSMTGNRELFIENYKGIAEYGEDAILLQTKGNKDYLFADDPYVSAGSDYLKYDIPGEALTDQRFANMIREAEKYLGYPYVWGGSSPSTSFDCSGFVCYVIDHCGNGWNVGRTTAEGLRNYCKIIRPSDARPGDLIFFQKTYNTSGASHVGIYVGNGMMIHCGNPISYASVNTSYWQEHFYCYGRIPN